MRIASFDIGKRNFALCVEEGDRLLLLENHDLTTKGDDLIPVMLEMTRILTERNEIFDRCASFLIEQQMFFGKSKNVMAVKLAQHCISHFINRYGVLRDIQEFPAFHKTRVYNAPKMTKPERKKWAIHKAIQVLTERNDPFLSNLNQFKKKDDVADTILHIQAYKILNTLNQTKMREQEFKSEQKSEEMNSPDELNTLTKPKLKEMCRDRGLPVSGNKPQLIERLTGSSQLVQAELTFDGTTRKATTRKTTQKTTQKKAKTKRNTVHTNTGVILKRLAENRVLYKFTRNGDGFYCWDGWIFNEIKQVVDHRVVDGVRRPLTTEDMIEAKSLTLPLDLASV